VRPRRPEPELHVIVRLEAVAPVVRVHAETFEDEQRLVVWLRQHPGAVLRIGDTAFAVLAALLAIEGEEDVAW
jgi:hypothetical protein